jgi:DNA-binding MarR family transcriptional regulator
MTEGPDERPLPPLLEDRLGYLLGITHGGLRALVEGGLRDELGLDLKRFGVPSTKSFGVLTALVGLDEAPSQQALADLIRMDRTTMVAIVDALEEAGYVARRRNPADRREQLLDLTPAGRRVQERANRIVIEVERDFLSSLSEEEAERLRRLLQKVARHRGRADAPQP